MYIHIHIHKNRNRTYITYILSSGQKQCIYEIAGLDRRTTNPPRAWEAGLLLAGILLGDKDKCKDEHFAKTQRQIPVICSHIFHLQSCVCIVFFIYAAISLHLFRYMVDVCFSLEERLGGGENQEGPEEHGRKQENCFAGKIISILHSS